MFVPKTRPALRKQRLSTKPTVCFRKQCLSVKLVGCFRKQYLSPKHAPLYETSACPQNRHRFTKPVPVPKTRPALRNQCLSTKHAQLYETSACPQNTHHFTKAVFVCKTGGLFSKAVSVPKTRTALRNQCLSTKHAPLYESSACPQNTHSFTKPVPVPKTRPALRNQCLSTKHAPLYETNACPQNTHRFTKPVPVHKTRTALRNQCLSPKQAPLYETSACPQNTPPSKKTNLPLTPLVTGNGPCFTVVLVRLQQSGSVYNFLCTQFVSLTVNPPPHNFFYSKRSRY